MFKKAFPALIFAFLITGCGSTSPGQTAADKEEEIRGSPRQIDPDAKPTPKLKTRSQQKPQLYKVESSRPLELPPDLVGTTNEAVLENLEKAQLEETRILPEIVNARIIKDGDERWLEIDTNVETAWRAVTEYWSLSGINLVDYNPEAGIMETTWIEQPVDYEGDSVFVQMTKQIFTSLTKTDTALDKYRLRFERLNSDQAALYVDHRSMVRKEVDYSKKVSDFEWVELPSNPNREAELLQNLVLLFDEDAA